LLAKEVANGDSEETEQPLRFPDAIVTKRGTSSTCGLPARRLDGMSAIGLQWRATTADAVYVQPNVPVAGTAGRGSAWTGAYGQLRADYAFDDHLTGAIELVHFEIGDAIRQAGGHTSNYAGVQLQYGW
jgi:hypothetical protein